MMAEGCERASYPSIVGSGINSTTLHYAENSKVMETGDVVVIDAAGEYSMYASDLTRTMPVDGHFTARQKEIYDIVLGAQRAARDAFVAGQVEDGRTGRTARQTIRRCWTKSRMTTSTATAKICTASRWANTFSTAWAIRLASMCMTLTTTTKPFVIGSVFTIEPGIYIPEEKIGVRIEDTFYVDDSGKLIDFAEKLPHTTDEVEAAMRASKNKEQSKNKAAQKN